MKQKQLEPEKPPVTYYKGLPKMLHGVRWTQRFFAILAEVLILIAFFASGMDLGVGGTMANALGLKWAWAGIFALGVDTSFVVSWIRCRQVGRSWRLLWCIPVALGMSFVVFEPVVIQLMQATLNIGFNQAVALLGINLIVLVYGRALVAVILGAVLALTNVESAMSEEVSKASSGRRVFIPLQKLMDKYAPVVDAQTRVIVDADVQPLITQNVQQRKRPLELVAPAEPMERVKQALAERPDASDREIAKLSNVSPTTAGKYRKLLKVDSEAV